MEESNDWGVSFIVGEEKEFFTIRKSLLTKSCPVFSAMLNGNFQESVEETKIRIEDVKPKGFEKLIEHCKGGSSIQLDDWAPTLYAAEKYEVLGLKNDCKYFVKANVRPENALKFYIEASVNHVLPLLPNLKTYLLVNGNIDIKSIPNSNILNEIISSDYLIMDEVQVFKQCVTWASSRIKELNKDGPALREALGKVLFSIRLPRLTQDELLNEVYPNEILTDKELLDILRSKACSRLLQTIEFISRPRMSRCALKYVKTAGYTSMDSFSLDFNADKSLYIYGLGITSFSDVKELSVQISLKQLDSEKTLDIIYFEMKAEDILKGTVVEYYKPFLIIANINYRIMIKYYSSVSCNSANIFNPNRTADGVHWKLMNCSFLADYCMISDIYFKTIDKV